MIKKIYKNTVIMLLMMLPYALIGMKGPMPKDFSFSQAADGRAQLYYKTAHNQIVEFVFISLQRVCPQQNFSSTPQFFYEKNKTQSSSMYKNTKTEYDASDLRTYSMTTFNDSNDVVEKFYNPDIVKLDKTLLKNTSVSMKDFGIKLQIDTISTINNNMYKIETLYHPNNIDVIKLYDASGQIEFELIIDTDNNYTAQLTMYNSQNQIETYCYQIASIKGIDTDFYLGNRSSGAGAHSK